MSVRLFPQKICFKKFGLCYKDRTKKPNFFFLSIFFIFCGACASLNDNVYFVSFDRGHANPVVNVLIWPLVQLVLCSLQLPCPNLMWRSFYTGECSILYFLLLVMLL